MALIAALTTAHTRGTAAVEELALVWSEQFPDFAPQQIVDSVLNTSMRKYFDASFYVAHSRVSHELGQLAPHVYRALYGSAGQPAYRDPGYAGQLSEAEVSALRHWRFGTPMGREVLRLFAGMGHFSYSSVDLYTLARPEGGQGWSQGSIGGVLPW